MKVILRNYGIGMNTRERQDARRLAEDMVRTRGTSRPPAPPRGIIAQPGPRGVLLSWALPEGYSADIQRWRIYKGDENTLYAEIQDRGTRQHFIECTAGSTPPVTNFFVSSLNNFGIESPKMQIQAQALAESGAPAMPSSPPEYSTTEGSNKTTGYKTLLTA